MYRLWESIIKPLFYKIEPNLIIEVGSEKGNNTKNVLEYCKTNDAKLISIDPLPQFDVNLFKMEYKDKFEIYEDLSLNCLKFLENYDVILLDGDHNYYTVYNELKAIEEKCNDDFPFIILHDISWPYARRDCYYNPKTIPFEYLHPHEKNGVYPEIRELTNEGMNSTIYNAKLENTPRNGVLTGIEDFLDESEKDLYFFKIELFNGLGIICPNTQDNINLIKEIFENSNVMYLCEIQHVKISLDKNKIINSLKNEKLRLNNENKNLKENINNLIGNKELLKGLSKNNETLAELAKNKEVLIELTKNYQNQNIIINELKENQEKNILKLEKTCENQKLTIETLNEKLNNFKQRNTELTKSKNKISNKLASKNEDITVLNEKNENMMKRIEIMTKNNKNLRDTILKQENQIKQQKELQKGKENEMKRQKEKTQKQLKELQKEKEKLKNTIEEYKSSTSWKITSPLRKIKRIIKNRG